MYNKSNRKLGKRWTKADEQRLIEKAREGRTTRQIAYELGRSEYSIYNKAAEMGVSLKDNNNSAK